MDVASIKCVYAHLTFSATTMEGDVCLVYTHIDTYIDDYDDIDNDNIHTDIIDNDINNRYLY